MKISIIVPVYNTAAYLPTCLDSLLRQTNKDYEIILINDCSTDASPQLCNLYSQENSSIRVIHFSVNRGVSAARNCGVKQSRGEWITFIDSDDWVREDYIENLLLFTDRADWILSGDEYFRDGKSVKGTIFLDEKWTLKDLRSEKVNYLDVLTSPHGKLFKREIIEKYGIQFRESLSWGEDRDFNIEYLSHIQNICSSSYVGYCYNEDVEGSLSKCPHEGFFEEDVRYWNKINKLLGGYRDDYLVNRLFYFIVDDVVEIVKKQGGLQACVEIRKLKPMIDSKYLKRHLDKVKAPTWQKLIVKVCL